MKLSALWVALMFIYIYADILSIFRPGADRENDARVNGSFSRDSRFVVISLNIDDHSCCYGFPILNTEAKVNRWVNIILGVLFTFVNISNLIGETPGFTIYSLALSRSRLPC